MMQQRTAEECGVNQLVVFAPHCIIERKFATSVARELPTISGGERGGGEGRGGGREGGGGGGGGRGGGGGGGGGYYRNW